LRHFVHADIGPTKEWGVPVSAAEWRKWHSYPLHVWDVGKKLGLVPDLVLIDGRFRLACFLATLLFAKAGCRIFFDDYAPRPQYQTAERFAAPATRTGRMAEFVVPKRLERDEVWRALVGALRSPA
jgi:hypothetical protein